MFAAAIALASLQSIAACEGDTCPAVDPNNEGDAAADVSSMLQGRLTNKKAEEKRSTLRQGSIAHRITQDPGLVDRAAAHLGLNISLLNLGEESFLEIMEEHDENFDPKAWLKAGSAAAGKQKHEEPSKLVTESSQALSVLGTVVSKFMTGDSVSFADFSGIIADKLQGVVDKFLTQIFTKGFASIIGMIFGGIIGWLIGLFMPKPPSTGELIKQALVKERMAENKDWWNAFIDEMNWMPSVFGGKGHSDAKMAWYLVLQHDLAVTKPKAFRTECLSSTTWDHDDCKKWIKDGMWEVMVPYAQMHLSVIWELTASVMTNPLTSIANKQNQVEILVARAREVGTEYVQCLKHAWTYFFPYRMSLIWDEPHIPRAGGQYYHPFDFWYAHKGRGFDKLDLKPPVDKTKDVRTQHKGVTGWGYKGCEGERHEAVTKKKSGDWSRRRRSTNANHHCNLYQRITRKKTGGSAWDEGSGCGCAKGHIGRHRWDDERMPTDVSSCWHNCATAYAKEEERILKKSFGEVVTAMEKFVNTNLKFPPTLKVDLQEEKTVCEEQSIVTKAKCIEGLKMLKPDDQPKGGLLVVKDSKIPGGCSIRTKDGRPIYNEATQASMAKGYRPLCAAVFFSR
jgi:hypothetical protein